MEETGVPAMPPSHMSRGNRPGRTECVSDHRIIVCIIKWLTRAYIHDSVFKD